MIFIAREERFICQACGKHIEPLGKGTYRNHCPKCLHSLHVDDLGPGDRASKCLGIMEPIGIDQESKKGFVLIHQCKKCKKVSRNRAAVDDDLIGFTRVFHQNV